MVKQAKIQCPHCKGHIIVRVKEGKPGQPPEAEALIDKAFDAMDDAFDAMNRAFNRIFGK